MDQIFGKNDLADQYLHWAKTFMTVPHLPWHYAMKLLPIKTNTRSSFPDLISAN